MEAGADRRVRLFVTDIDGCLAEPYRTYDIEPLAELRRIHVGRQEAGAGLRPRLSICSGRAFPYVEAVAQLLALEGPVLFEAGGGMFNLSTGRIEWNPEFTRELARQVADVRDWMVADVLPGTALSLDFAKRTQASVAGPVPAEVAASAHRVRSYVGETHPDLLVASTPVSVDVLPYSVNKASGLQWLAALEGIDLGEMAFMGDTDGDLAGLKLVGFSFAPSNATDEVKRSVRHVTQAAVVEGVLEAYLWCSAHNLSG